ncbi:MAG: hypothetical protein HY080_08175 [Gammaproteobacteria bacterium]|nr:hypothetical protein [Gammaproteobacteria bacterium]
MYATPDSQASSHFNRFRHAARVAGRGPSFTESHHPSGKIITEKKEGNNNCVDIHAYNHLSAIGFIAKRSNNSILFVISAIYLSGSFFELVK